MSSITWLKRHTLYIGLTLLAVIVAVTVTSLLVGKQASPASKDLSSVKDHIGELMLLPKNEEPTLAIVQDKTKLKDKFLMSKAQNGDQVLIYTKNGIAIVYRPSINKIVAVSPVTVDLALAESNGTSITILNGTNDPNIASKVESEIKAKYPDVTTTIGNANKRDFPTTIIIDNTDAKDDLVTSLEGLINGQRGVVPLSEGKGSSDLVIIIGQDRL